MCFTADNEMYFAGLASQWIKISISEFPHREINYGRNMDNI